MASLTKPARFFEHSENTKLCQQINGGRRQFRDIKKIETFKRLCIQMETANAQICAVDPEVEMYEQWFNTLFKKDFGKSNQETDFGIPKSDNEFVLPDEEGHYDPEELLNSLCCIER